MRSFRVALLALVTLAISIPAGPSPAPRVHLPTRLAASSGSWTTYHHDDGHTGNDPSLPQVSSVTTGWTSAALDQDVYAEPLVYNGIVYAATLNDTVYALHQSDGTQVWMRNLGTPQSGGWTCGNVSPQGILGTPVIDVAGSRIYVAAFFSNDTYHVIGLDLATGATKLDTTLNITGFIWQIEQQRGALAFHNGNVYVPFGGRAGDCGFPNPPGPDIPYHGYVVAVPASGIGTPPVYTVASAGSGIWSAGGVVVDDATGNVFASTGNGIAGGCNAVNQNDAVVRLSSTMAFQDYFMPNDWQADWCSNDQDLGSAGPLLISPNLLFQAGKWGGGFLLNPNNLGGVNGQLFPARAPYNQADVCHSITSDATFGSFAYAAPFVYVSCEGGASTDPHGLVALNVNTGAPSFSPCDTTCAAPDWAAGGTTVFGPPIVAGGAVWVANDGGGLYAFNATTGAKIYQSAGFRIHRFVTPAEAGGSVYVPSFNVIRSFDMNFASGGAPLDLGGYLTSGPGGASWGPTHADVFVRGTDNGLWQISWNGSSWGPWAALGGYIASDPGPVSWGTGRIDVFAEGGDRELWHKYWDNSVNRWSGWEALGGILTSGPTVSSWGYGRLDVFVRGTDYGLWHKYWDIANGRWSGWEALGGYLTSDPAAISWGTNRVDVFVRGGDDGLYQRSWDPSGWHPWVGLGGKLVSAPTASSCAPGTIDIFLLGTDSGLWRRTFAAGAWGAWQDFGGPWTSKPSAVCRPGTSTTDVYERGTEGSLWHLSY